MSAPTPTRPRIDPRLRRRRVEVARARGRRRRRVLAGVVVVALVAAAAYGLARSSLLAVDEIVVTGAEQVGVEEVRAASGIAAGDAILFADLAAAAARIEELPWVRSAHVGRDLPGTVRIEVTERVPVAWFGGPDGSVALVDGSGRVLAIEAEPGDLPELVGLDAAPGDPGREVAPAGLAGLVVELPDALVARVREVVRTPEGREHGAVLVLHEGPEIRLGALEQISEKGSAALAVLAGLGDEPASYVDVRVPSVAVTG